nr:uncharacterized protein LOC127321672 [Lolium perenne]
MMNRGGAGQFPPPPSPPPPPPPQEFDIDPEAAENEAWEKAALADTIAVFDAATTEEARRRRVEEMGERWHAEQESLPHHVRAACRPAWPTPSPAAPPAAPSRRPPARLPRPRSPAPAPCGRPRICSAPPASTRAATPGPLAGRTAAPPPRRPSRCPVPSLAEPLLRLTYAPTALLRLACEHALLRLDLSQRGGRLHPLHFRVQFWPESDDSGEFRLTPAPSVAVLASDRRRPLPWPPLDAARRPLAAPERRPPQSELKAAARYSASAAADSSSGLQLFRWKPAGRLTPPICRSSSRRLPSGGGGGSVGRVVQGMVEHGGGVCSAADGWAGVGGGVARAASGDCLGRISRAAEHGKRMATLSAGFRGWRSAGGAVLG